MRTALLADLAERTAGLRDDGLFKTESLHKRVNEIAARLRPILEKDSPGTINDWEKEVAALREHIAARMKFLAEELAMTATR